MRSGDSRKKYRGPERRNPVLIVQHAPHEHPAALRRALESQGILTSWIHPYRGDAFPDLSDIRGMISLGGPMSANDEAIHPWIRPECELLRQCVENTLPVVGICLGGQMLAKALGGEVLKNHIAEVGWFPIEINSDGQEDRILGSAGTQPLVYHWHFDTFYLPPGAKLLAHSHHCARQAYRVGDNAYGFQFHPEADHQLVHEWLAVEGTEEDISCTQEEYGAESVQDADTQRDRAEKGEKASLKITTAIAQLFKDQEYAPISNKEYEQYEAWATLRTELLIEFEGSDRKKTHLRGQIATLLTLPDGDFLILREESSILWPIRMDFIKKVKPTEK